MNTKELFIKVVDAILKDVELTDYVNFFSEDELNIAFDFWEKFKASPQATENNDKLTENGAKVLKWMQENEVTMANTFTSKEIAEGLFTSGRSIAGSMRKLVANEYVDKTGKNPIQYSLTDKGKNVNV